MKDQYTVELAMIRAIPDFARQKPKKCRLSSLYRRLQNAVDKELSKQPMLTDHAVLNIENQIFEFGTIMGWEKKAIDIQVLFSFVLGLIDNSQYKFTERIIKTLNDCFDWITRDNPEIDLFEETEEALRVWKQVNRS